MEWISVNDQLPIGRVVAVLAFNGKDELHRKCVFVSTYFEQTKSFSTEKIGLVTHWMPLPEPPKSNTNG